MLQRLTECTIFDQVGYIYFDSALEIAIFTRFVLQSRSNAEEFAADRLIDVVEIATALKKMEAQIIAPKPSTQLDPLIQECQRQMTAEGVIRSRFLQTKDLAKLAGMLSEYETVNKVCSKFVHPTSWSLLAADEGSAQFPSATDVFFLYGTNFFTRIFADVAQHVGKYGFHHKP